MARHTAQQLPLPGSLDTTVQLCEELAFLRAHFDQVSAELQSESCQVLQAQEENAALRRQLSAVRAERDIWRNNAQTTQIFLNLAHAAIARLSAEGGRSHSPSIETWVGQELRKLLALAHPDKWSAGQGAPALAHEVAAAVNALRERLGEGRA